MNVEVLLYIRKPEPGRCKRLAWFYGHVLRRSSSSETNALFVLLYLLCACRKVFHVSATLVQFAIHDSPFAMILIRRTAVSITDSSSCASVPRSNDMVKGAGTRDCD